MKGRLPEHAWTLLGPRVLPWTTARKYTETFEALQFGGVFLMNAANGQRILVFTADADIDTDGPGGSTDIDPWWSSQTSLRYSNTLSCDSRTFPGIVTPPGLRSQFGMRLGDFGFICWHGELVPVQVYDSGPTRKIGEVSEYAGRSSGIIPPTQSSHSAATYGNNVSDCVYVVYIGSGNGFAVAPPLIAHNAYALREQVSSRLLLA